MFTVFPSFNACFHEKASGSFNLGVGILPSFFPRKDLIEGKTSPIYLFIASFTCVSFLIGITLSYKKS